MHQTLCAIFGVALLWGGAAPSSAAAQTGPIDRLDTPAFAGGAGPSGLILDIASTAAPGGAGRRLVAVGGRGRILLSDDAGALWRAAPSPAAVELTAVAFSAGGVGLAVGHDGVILRSPDGGDSWVKAADGRGLFPRHVAAAKTRVAAAEVALAAAAEDAREDAEFALDDESFRLETAETSIAYGPAWPFLDVAWIDEVTAWAVGAYGLAFVSGDAGENWDFAGDRFDNVEDFHLYSLLKTSTGALIAAGEAGVIFRSADDGASWERFDSFDGASLFGLAEFASAEGPALIAYGFGESYQLSTDDGANWEPQDIGASTILIGHVQDHEGDAVLALGASGQMIALGLGGAGAKSQPTGERSFLSAGVALPGDGGVLIGSETGLTVAPRAAP